MKKYFHTKREIKTIVYDVVSLEEFKIILKEYKPTKIFNVPYSKTVPCWYITEYIDDNTISYYANSFADKTPIIADIEKVYKSWRIQGLDECYFV